MASPPDPPAPPGPRDDPRLAELRARIDEIDGRLVELLNTRARVVMEIGARKRSTGGPVYAPHREAAVLERVLGANDGPLPDRTVEAVFREIMSGSFVLEQPPRVGYVGPPGSRAHAAARQHFGTSVEYEDVRSRSGLVTEVARCHVDYALVPVDPGEPGAPADPVSFFAGLPQELHVYAEVHAHLPDALLAACEPSEVRTIHATAGAFERCARWLATQYPRADRQLAPSAAAAVAAARDQLARGPGSGAAALAPRLAGELHGLAPLFSDVQDDPTPRARHLVLSRARALPTGQDRTTLLLTLDDRPGALAAALATLAEHGVAGLGLRQGARATHDGAVFLLDVDGHQGREPLSGALATLAGACRHLRILGSYPTSATPPDRAGLVAGPKKP